MGFFKKIFKGIGKVFKKIGKGIKKVAGKIGKAFGKLGIVGTIALGILAPYALGAISTWAGGLAASGNAFVAGFGKLVGAATKVIGGVGKAVGSVTEAVTSTISNVVGKVGGEALKKLGVENFMGKDLTQLDSWSQIWGKTQESFAGVKGAFTEGVTKQASLFDTGMKDKLGITKGINKSAIESSVSNIDFNAKDTFTPLGETGGTINMEALKLDPNANITQSGNINMVNPTDNFVPLGETGGAVNTEILKLDPNAISDSLLAPLDTSAKKAGIFQDPNSIGSRIYEAGKDRAIAEVVDYGAQKIFGGGDEGTVGGGLGLVNAGQVQVASGSEVQMAFAPIENPQSSWGMRLAEMPTAYDPFGLTGRQQVSERINVTG